MAISWLKGIGILGALSGVSSLIGITTADYTFPVPSAGVGFMIAPTENQINRFVASIKSSEEGKAFRDACRAGTVDCGPEALIERFLPDTDALPREFWSFTVVATNYSDLEVRNVHISFVARSASGEAVWHDFVHSGFSVPVGEQITGSLALNDALMSAEMVDVCVSYRGRYHFDVIRETYTMTRAVHYDQGLPGFEMIGFSQRGSIERTAGFDVEHCPRQLI